MSNALSEWFAGRRLAKLESKGFASRKARSWRAIHHVECPERVVRRPQVGEARVEGLREPKGSVMASPPIMSNVLSERFASRRLAKRESKD